MPSGKSNIGNSSIEGPLPQVKCQVDKLSYHAMLFKGQAYLKSVKIIFLGIKIATESSRDILNSKLNMSEELMNWKPGWEKIAVGPLH